MLKRNILTALAIFLLAQPALAGPVSTSNVTSWAADLLSSVVETVQEAVDQLWPVGKAQKETASDSEEPIPNAWPTGDPVG